MDRAREILAACEDLIPRKATLEYYSSRYFIETPSAISFCFCILKDTSRSKSKFGVGSPSMKWVAFTFVSDGSAFMMRSFRLKVFSKSS